jgi:hypothetical protein
MVSNTNNAKLHISNSWFELINNNIQAVLNTGILSLDHNRFEVRPNAINVAAIASSSRAIISGNEITDAGTGSGGGITIVTDDYTVVSDNVLPGRAIALPGTTVRVQSHNNLN